MKWLAITIALTPILASAPAVAKQNYHILGTGTISCGRWTEDRANDVLHASDVTWLQGYLTAFNRWGPEQPVGDITRGTDQAGMGAAMDNYCSLHPLETVNDAASALILLLVEARKSKN